MALKERVGTVVSDKMDKTVVVAVENRFPHPIYQKTVRRTTRYKAHDETNSCKVGDRVRITDILDTALNVQTLRLIASSHAISSFRLLPGNLLEVVFDQIALPDSNSNEPASHGFVSFAIKRNKAFNKTRKVLNTAAIYFDFNEPIITNTVITPVATPTVSSFEPNTTDTQFAGLVISPNPTAKDFVVDTRGRLSGTGNMELFNAQGKICLSIPVTDLSSPINVAITGLTDGAYTVRATGKNGVLFGKVVVVR
jgi:small subunit ribosomal protein S17